MNVNRVAMKLRHQDSLHIGTFDGVDILSVLCPSHLPMSCKQNIPADEAEEAEPLLEP